MSKLRLPKDTYKEITPNFFTEDSWEQLLSLEEECIEINISTLDKELEYFPQMYSFWCSILHSIKRCFDEIGIELSQTRSEISLSFREKANVEKKKISEKALEDLVEGNTQYMNLKKKYNFWAYRYNRIKSIINALEYKKDMIIQISSNRRAEYRLHT